MIGEHNYIFGDNTGSFEFDGYDAQKNRDGRCRHHWYEFEKKGIEA
jgi:hypothetical protein